jgi:Family of unknown function (DUF5681)
VALWKKGESGNPAGRPTGARNKLVGSFIDDLQANWDAEGTAILDRVAVEDPGKIVDAIRGLAPREIAATIDQKLGGLDAEKWAVITRIAEVVNELAPGATPDQVEQALRVGFSLRTEHQAETSSA